MKKIFLLAVLASGLTFGQSKKVVASDVHWWGYKVAKSEASSHDGTVKVKSGDMVMKGNNLVGGSFVLDMTSINATDLTGEYQQKLNGHLKNGDFFEVEKFPTASFKITSVKKNSDKIYNSLVTGNLTVKGKTNAVTFPAKIAYSKGVVSLVSDKFSFDRQKFDVAYKSTMQDVFVKDDIEMLVKVTAK
ncbi:YceI family protein [Chryseobacterium lathyri]|jgi:polyisoprenoid-binding protein YceI|uniref:Polyisoprenoid-binding protein YceI n=1 Tax=Chryseobacterium lathyri TaxID=395933 RepID=A0ABT9SQX6_9FLAO|nr:YceI family protein [Chryseobacterium lathyri]MDP9960880.1 polyisoprenoid-binding protein YceI [Chryseobacterium lathyri]MDQ0065614.1 polyisoprenoid-binding protein YceI [Chryseobacterium lathyri]